MSDFLDGMIYVKLEELTTPKQGRTCHVDRWWILHPEKGAAFYQSRRSPQCNDWEHGVRDWVKRFPGHVVQQMRNHSANSPKLRRFNHLAAIWST